MKKIIALLLVVAMTAAASVAGTIAYLSDTDSDVNVMTVGNVYIEQIEQERDANGDLVDFTQDKPAYPVVGPIAWADKGVDVNGTEYKVFTADLKNVVDKIVTVKNVGKSDAYVRTIVAIEAPDGDPENLIHVNVSPDGLTYTAWDLVEIDGVDYVYSVFTYADALKPGKISTPSLVQVFLDSKATNEYCELLGDEWNILVLSQAVQTAGFENPATALDTAFGVANDENVIKWFKGVIDEHSVDTWDGTADTTWYNEAATEFEISTAEQLAGLSKLVDEGTTFEGKTVKLVKDIDLYILGDNGEPICFEPIGSYRKDTPFKGVFDGQGNTISNMSQNTWALDNGYYYGDLGLGLFGKVEDATVKNLNMDKASVSGESAMCGTVAATAYGDCVFENITVTNSQVADYQYYAGGIVGWASGDHQYINCKVDASTTIAAQWGDFDNSVGGVIGGCGGSATILLKDCEVACRIDAYNDVTSTYRWYAYRRAGMLIGNTGKTVSVGETTYAAAPQLTCENVTVIYDDWANYTYCAFAGTSWPYVRVQAGISNSAYSNPRYGHPTDANGNTVVDDNHVHNDGEDHFIDCTFDQLYGGGQGVYGDSTHDGVTVVYNNK